MTPEDKANEYLSGYSKEKSIDVAETMRDYAIDNDAPEWVYFWECVIKIINNKTINHEMD